MILIRVRSPLILSRFSQKPVCCNFFYKIIIF